jgi:serine/threonine protein kinase/Tfp pilus assembly protein PilF
VVDTRAQDDPTQQSYDALAIGTTFAGRYQIDALLGRGGMGAVYRVRDLELDEVVALKLLDGSTSAPDALERFRREVRLARRVTHRNAARTFDLGEHDGLRFLTMEYVDGPSLRELQEQRRLELAKVLDVVRQIADGLAAAHAAAVMHRDLKPANVLIESSPSVSGIQSISGIGRAVITDFGIARGLQASDETLQTHGTLGTPAYMAPEQLGGELVGPPADVYALGLIAYELLTGELPYKRASTMETALARLHESPPDLAATHDVDPDLASLLALMLSRAPEERPPPAEVANAIAEQQDALGRLDQSEISTPTPIRRLSLAILPFLYRGPPDTAYIGEALGDELIDLLAMTKSLRVSAGGATARYTERRDRDPRTIGAELGVDALVDGTVQVAGERVRIAARLLDGDTGFQRWSERFEGSIGDVFELQDKLGKRIAEALRVEVEHSVHRGDATPEAIEHYLRGRQLARVWDFKGPGGAVAQFARCLELAPSFKPALAAHALACERVHFLPRAPGEPDWREMAEQAIELALGWAPELAETHLAAARWKAQQGDYRGAAAALRLALSIAPTYAAAHEYLGQLQLEGGRTANGLAHLEQARDLDPSLVFSFPGVARYHALRGELDNFDSWIARYYETEPRPTDIPVRLVEARVAAWYGRHEHSQTVAAAMTKLMPPSSTMLAFVETLWCPDIAADELRGRVDRLLPFVPNPHFRTSMLQVACESALLHGHRALALEWLAAAAAGTLADLDWLERCVMLEPLHGEAAYRGTVMTVQARVEAIWWQ